ncbi:TPA: outer membrane beta-barrel protein [Vibrio vulnificus]|nr:outer membrane beta-barrel protein [Vibrio vulnificus]HDY7586555.1 porin family protein [Vibrio vulnificus]HDY7906582.1 porin family protein [Vibrio vulnificus]HDY7910859.1 porin family protein [Vibrio vulnificus]
MKKLSLITLALVTTLPAAAYAKGEMGSMYTNVGATMVSNGNEEELAYFFQVGYNHRITDFLSADVSYKKVETVNSSVAANSKDFVQTYNAYGVGLRVDQHLGALSIYGKAGASYIESELTKWDTVTSAEKTTTDDSFKPYASAGVSLASPFDKRLTLDAAVTYQMLPNDEHATSVSAGVKFSF